jgi:type IV pilus assembly protein PilW
MSPNPRAQSGMSIVELMVAMMVGLIGIVIISHLYITNEKYKRSTAGTGSAQVNGAVALYGLERDLRMAGFGLNHSAAFACTCDKVADPACSPVQYYYNGVYSRPLQASAYPALTFAPVVITETPNLPDSITVAYGGDAERMLPGRLTETMPNSASELKVDGTAGYTVSDMLVVANGPTCVLMQVTTVQDAASHLQHATASLWNAPAGGLLPAFPIQANVFNLGQPTWRTYSVANNTLQYLELVTATGPGLPANAIQTVDEIVDLQAEYGKDVDGDGTVETWDTNTPANAGQWQQVLAVRVAVLARIQNYEWPDPITDPCSATTSANRPTWGGGQDFPVLMVAGVLPSCYKYRAFETIVPLRNMIWRPA